ncbi:cell surface glycoprotein MUC18 isoform X2 [Lynx rufus]|uniref:cell surface glycoprotein MUC18 isoform X2 n=1 Tax=Lynx rufus TaxID=61384 RepID=UPI001F128586|nr:cell surface glycoprotein MUC18 isoform X2 [Lynx rufus]
MGPSGLVCALLLAACCCCRRAAGVPGEAEPPTPEPLEVEVGGTALLKCGPSHSPGNFSHVDWFSVHKEKPTLIFRVRKGQGQSEPGEYQHRLSLLDRGTTLALAHVTPHDERIFLCQGKRPQSQEHRIQLHVYKAPEEPTIQVNPLGISVNSEEPEEVATCVGRNGYPVPQVIWYKNGRPLKEEKKRVHIQSSQIVESSGLYTLQSVLKAQLVKEDKDAQFYCELNYRLPSGNHMKESREVVVPVFYPAEKVWLEVEPVGVLKEGDRVEIRCLADGNPPPHFTISKQNPSTQEMEEKATEDNGVLVLESARKEHSGLYQCQGLDLETMASLPSEQQELLVNYVSDVRVSPAAPESREGGSLALTCEAESNRALEFQWLREKTGQVLEKGPVLRLHNLQRDAGGGYRCVASVPSVPGLNRTQLVRVAIFGSPWMTSKERKMWVKENTVLNLSCEASGHPRPSISWSVDGTAHEQDQDPQSVLSVLNVLVTPELLETGAECVASNFLGRNTTTIFLELDSNRTTGLSTSTVSPYTRANSTSTEKKLPEPESKGVAIVAVTVCVLVLAVLGAVLYFFYKKGKLPCGRSGKQEITLPPSRKSEFVVEVKSDKLPEEMGLLQGSTGDKRAPGDQVGGSSCGQCLTPLQGLGAAGANGSRPLNTLSPFPPPLLETGSRPVLPS